MAEGIDHKSIEVQVGELASSVSSLERSVSALVRQDQETNTKLDRLVASLQEKVGGSADALRSEFRSNLADQSQRQSQTTTRMISVAAILVTIALAVMSGWFNSVNTSTELRFSQEQKRTDDRFVQLLERIKDSQNRTDGSIKETLDAVKSHMKDGHPYTVLERVSSNSKIIDETILPYQSKIEDRLDRIESSRFTLEEGIILREKIADLRERLGIAETISRETKDEQSRRTDKVYSEKKDPQ